MPWSTRALHEHKFQHTWSWAYNCHQVWVANMEIAISVAKIAKGNFCMQETLRQLRTPLSLPTIHYPPITTTINVRNTSPNPPQIYYATIVIPRTCACHASSTKTPYSKPCTNHCSSWRRAVLMVINTYIIYESLEGLSCYNIIGGVGVPVSLRHNGLSVARIRGSSHPCGNIQDVVK